MNFSDTEESPNEEESKEEMKSDTKNNLDMESNFCSLVSSLSPGLLIETSNVKSSLNIYNDGDEIDFDGGNQLNWNWTDSNSNDEQ